MRAVVGVAAAFLVLAGCGGDTAPMPGSGGFGGGGGGGGGGAGGSGGGGSGGIAGAGGFGGAGGVGGFGGGVGGSGGDLCAGVNCGNGTRCDPADGTCKCGGPGGVVCVEGQTCSTDPLPHCLSDLCIDVVCPSEERCDPTDGTCRCGVAICAQGEVCSAGRCVVPPL